MILTIRKKGNKNFFHFSGGFEYAASDLVIFNDTDNRVKLRTVSGRIIFERDGWLVTDVRIYDDTQGGSEESFSTFELLANRLITLGYPAYYEDSTGVADWGNIGGVITNQIDLIDYINTQPINGGTP